MSLISIAEEDYKQLDIQLIKKNNNNNSVKELCPCTSNFCFIFLASPLRVYFHLYLSVFFFS